MAKVPVGTLGKAIGGVKTFAKNYWPALINPAMQAYGLANQYQADTAAEAQYKAHPPRRALASIPGSSTISSLRQNLMPVLGKTAGDKNMANSLVTTLDQYLERERAFEWGVEQFCKQAGFDADDTKAMMQLLKEAAGAPGQLARRWRTRGGGSTVRPTASSGAAAKKPTPSNLLAPTRASTALGTRQQMEPGLGPNIVSGQTYRAPGSAVAQRLRSSMARKRRRSAMAEGGGGEPAGAGAMVGGAGDEGGQPQQQASGGPQPDGSWLPWAAALGGGYLAHGYGTEGGTYSMFDPPEVKAQKQKNRNDALGIKDPKATAAAAPAAGGTPALANDVAGRNRSMVENYKKQLELEGPDDPVTAARQLYGGVGQPSSMNNFNYFLGQDAGFQPWLEKTYGNERAQQIRAKLSGQTAGQPGAK